MALDIINDPRQITSYLPERLYKFRFWESQLHKDVLEKQHFYFSTPPQLWSVGDKDDCLFPIEFPKTPEDIYAVLAAMPDPNHWSAGMTDAERRRARWQQAHLNSDPVSLAQREKAYYKNQNEKLRVLSLTKRFDNEAMWDDSTYGSFSKGFCVGIDPRELIYEIFNTGITGNPCEYVPRGSSPIKYAFYSVDGPEASIEMGLQHLHMKYDDFSQEEEYRFVKRYHDQRYPKGVTESDFYLPVPKSAFKEVYIGYQLPKEEIQEIKDTCARHELSVDFYKAQPDGKGGIQVTLL